MHTPEAAEAPRPLEFHGDAELAELGAGATGEGALRANFAVNVRAGGPPQWLLDVLSDALPELGAYPPQRALDDARRAVANYHGVDTENVLLLAGAAEGFALLSNLAPRHALVVHPGFTEPEAALAAAGLPVDRMVLRPPFSLGGNNPSEPPEEADLVVIGNPTNPTGVVHDPRAIADWRRPGRTVVVDEAFLDVVGEEHSLVGLAARQPGLVVLRSLTKTWALAGLRCGYAVGSADTLSRLARTRPHWAMGTLQLTAVREVLARARDLLPGIRAELAAERVAMRDELARAGFAEVSASKAPYLLVRPPVPEEETAAEQLRRKLGAQGFAIRRCSTFPGLDAGVWRLAVRPIDQVRELVRAVERLGH